MAIVDLVVWGATGYTGRLIATYLSSLPTMFSWAIAGKYLFYFVI
jgi:short subunit dehydrogenase-like uncharacterized protein